MALYNLQQQYGSVRRIPRRFHKNNRDTRPPPRRSNNRAQLRLVPYCWIFTTYMHFATIFPSNAIRQVITFVEET